MNRMVVQPGDRSLSKDIQIKQIDLYYGDFHALKNINLDIRAGEFFAFLGPSGCGKTTLLRLLAGFNTARAGSVHVDGVEILSLPPWKRDIGMVFQSYALWPHLTVWKNVAFGLEERRFPTDEIKRRVKSSLDLVGLTHLADRRPSQLSGGQQQRVAVARTIAIEPKILLLDEPLSNLDAKMRVQVRRELRELQQRLGLTTVFVTHDQEEANTICDRIAVFKEGEIQQVGTPMELYDNPRNLFVAGFLGAANILTGKVIQNGSQYAFSVAGEAPIAIPPWVLAPEDTKLVFRPQNASFGISDASDMVLPGTIIHREFLGSSVRYSVKVGVNEVLVEMPFRNGTILKEVGTTTKVALSKHAMLWLSE